MTTASDFNALITALENNLQTMGVLDASFDSTTGVLGLVARILDIEASVGGIILSTSLSCTAASNSIYEGQSIILSGKLSASYNDTSQTDDDLEGYLKSATIEIYNGQTLLGTCTTDSNGEYLFTHQCNTAGTLNLTAKYEGTDFYDPSTSTSVTVSVNELTIEGISLSSDKSILSAADNEYATLTATLLDGNDDPIPISGETITFEVRKQSDDSLVETLTADTNSSGTAAVCYYGQGAGDIYIKTKCMNLIQTYSIVDGWFYDDQSTNKVSSYATRLSATGTYVANEYIQISNNTGDFRGLSPYELFTSDNWVVEADIMQTNDSNRQFKGFYTVRTDDTTSSIWLLQYGNETVFKDFSTQSSKQKMVSASINTWYHFKLELNNNVLTATVTDMNNTVLFNDSITLGSYFENKTIRPYIFAYDRTNTIRFRKVLVKPL